MAGIFVFQGIQNKIEFKLSLRASNSPISPALGNFQFALSVIQLAQDLADPVPFGQGRMKKKKWPSRNIYLPWTPGQHSFCTDCAEFLFFNKELTISYLDPALFSLRLIPKNNTNKMKNHFVKIQTGSSLTKRQNNVSILNKMI